LRHSSLATPFGCHQAGCGNQQDGQHNCQDNQCPPHLTPSFPLFQTLLRTRPTISSDSITSSFINQDWPMHQIGRDTECTFRWEFGRAACLAETCRREPPTGRRRDPTASVGTAPRGDTIVQEHGGDCISRRIPPQSLRNQSPFTFRIMAPRDDRRRDKAVTML